jgi:hypothetical protein
MISWRLKQVKLINAILSEKEDDCYIAGGVMPGELLQGHSGRWLGKLPSNARGLARVSTKVKISWRVQQKVSPETLV